MARKTSNVPDPAVVIEPAVVPTTIRPTDDEIDLCIEFTHPDDTCPTIRYRDMPSSPEIGASLDDLIWLRDHGIPAALKFAGR